MHRLKTLSRFVAAARRRWHESRDEAPQVRDGSKEQQAGNQRATDTDRFRAAVRLRAAGDGARAWAVREARSARAVKPGNRLGDAARQTSLRRTRGGACAGSNGF